MFSGIKFKLFLMGLLLLCMLVVPATAWALSIATTELPAASRQVFYSEPLNASGGDGSYTWSLYSGSLPPGLALFSEGILEGIPTATGNYSFTVRVRDGADDSVTKTITIRVLAASGPVITTSSLPVAQLGVSYGATLAAAQGQGPYTWSVQSGSLPPGLSLSGSGSISGSPANGGTYSFTARVRDNLGRTSHKNLTLSVEYLFITTEELPAATRLGLYSTPLYAAGGTGKYTWTLAGGRLPSGMALLSEGILAGVPTSRGNYSFTIRVRDGSNRSVSSSFTLLVEDRGALEVTTDDLTVLTPGKPKLFQLEAEGGEPPYSWSLLAGSLPRGLVLHKNGTISGTAQVKGETAFTVQVFDQSGLFREKKYVLEVAEKGAVPASPADRRPDDGAVRIYIDGQRLQMDAPPYLEKGRAFVPLRGVFEALKAEVIWDGVLGQVTIRKQATEITLVAGKKEARLNGHNVTLDAAPVMSNGCLMVPLRFVGEALGVQVHWDQETEQINIIKG